MSRNQNGFAKAFALTSLMTSTLLIGCANNNDSNNPTNNPAATTETKTAILHGAQQSPNITTNAAGYGTVIVNTTTRAISGSVTFTGITATAAHIHTGAPGASGSAAVNLTVDNAKHMAAIPVGSVLTQQQYDDLMAGNLYFNVHSSTNPTGEIRGQIGRLVMTTSLSGNQNSPPITTTATGTALVAVDPTNRTISGSIKFNGVTGTTSHLHTGAVGSNGAPVLDLQVDNTAGVATIQASATLTDAQYADLRAGKLYLNVHSDANKTGEIRGQVGPVVVTTSLDGATNVPATTSNAKGRAVFAVDPTTRSITGGISYEDINATSSHIHSGDVGVNGTGIVSLTVDGNTNTAIVPPNTTLTQIQYDDLIAGKLYVNVHSAANPAGEIRGQLILP